VANTENQKQPDGRTHQSSSESLGRPGRRLELFCLSFTAQGHLATLKYFKAGQLATVTIASNHYGHQWLLWRTCTYNWARGWVGSRDRLFPGHPDEDVVTEEDWVHWGPPLRRSQAKVCMRNLGLSCLTWPSCAPRGNASCNLGAVGSKHLLKCWHLPRPCQVHPQVVYSTTVASGRVSEPSTSWL
jgi:hypothetical protein